MKHSGVRTLTEGEFRAEALPVLERVFQPLHEPWEWNLEGMSHAPFQPAIEARSAIDCVPSMFSKEQARAFAVAARTIGDSGLYLYAQEGGLDPTWLESHPPCFFPLASDQDVEAFLRHFKANAPPIGQTLFSASGRWGALSYGGGDFAVAGGPLEFMAAVYATLDTTEEEQAQRFLHGYEGSVWLRDVRGGVAEPQCAWVPELLAHLYGEEKAARFIAEAAREDAP